MTEEEFRKHLNAANRANDLLWVATDNEMGIAVGLDSKRGVAILHGGKELPLADLRPISLGSMEPIPIADINDIDRAD